MHFDLFCYGTLCVEEIVSVLVGEHLEGKPALLHGYACKRVRGQAYPGLMPDPHSVTTGVIYQQVPVGYLRHLDDYEGDMYKRQALMVEFSGSLVPAYVYLLKSQYLPVLSARDWSIDQFRRQHLRAYIKRLSSN